MADAVKQVLARPIQLADSLSKIAGEVKPPRAECQELKAKAVSLANSLRLLARSDLYERPTRRITHEAEQALDKALALVLRCRAQNNLIRRLFTPIPTAALKNASVQLDRSAGDIHWLQRISTEDDIDCLGLPPIASNDPVLEMIWIQIAKLLKGSQEKKVEAAGSLVSYARDNDHYGRLIIDEGGVAPLLKLLKEGTVDGQVSAAKALALLAKDRESVEAMVQAGACPVFAKALKEGHMRVQTVVAGAMAEFADKYPPCQDVLALPPNNAVRLLVGRLSFEIIEEHNKYLIPPRATSIHSAVVANTETLKDTGTTSVSREEDWLRQLNHPMSNHSQNSRTHMHTVVQTTIAASSSTTGANRGRDQEDPATKDEMEAMAAKALWKLAKGKSAICRTITESRALLCFAVLLEKRSENVRLYSAMTLMEIAHVAEHEPDLRRFAFNPSASAAKAVVDQLIKIVEKGEYSEVLIPSIVTLGCLSKTFRATETRVVGPLVRLLNERETDVMLEATVALIKFTEKENHLHKAHSEAVIRERGIPSLVQLVLLGEHIIQMQALALLCLVALNVPESEEMAKSEVLNVLDWASKNGYIVQDDTVEDLLPEAKAKLELFQSRDPDVGRLEYQGFH